MFNKHCYDTPVNGKGRYDHWFAPKRAYILSPMHTPVRFPRAIMNEQETIALGYALET